MSGTTTGTMQPAPPPGMRCMDRWREDQVIDTFNLISHLRYTFNDKETKKSEPDKLQNTHAGVVGVLLEVRGRQNEFKLIFDVPQNDE